MARKEAIEKIKEITIKDDFIAFVKSLNLSRDDYRAMMEYIDELSVVQPEQCEWIPKEASNVPYGLIVECSKCKHSELIDNALYHKYCSNCGRKVIREYEQIN